MKRYGYRAEMSKSTSPQKKGEATVDFSLPLIISFLWLLLDEDLLAVNDIEALKIKKLTFMLC